MATTENTYTGNGSTTLYSFTFPYIEESDVYVSLDGSATTAYSYANATQIEFNTAPASGVAIESIVRLALQSKRPISLLDRLFVLET